MGNPKDKYLVYILTGFIILCYIPFYFLYKTIIKHKNFNETIENAGKAE
ncbi:putative membrane protein [Halobacteriovorax marinus SJ]|uniref:Membrane protein n=2 Tax=Halobacteriovorax marinus TaxID=97084 RepID=E1X2U9_HALMS|nr:putative membrane protein [Halobacteriovorax marinus SJ]